MITKLLFTFFLFLLNLLSLWALNYKNDQNDTILNYECIKNLREAIYIHTNKNIIVAGEKLFFKAYILGGNNTFGKSKILYTELIKNNNSVVKFTRTNIINGTSNSSFIIPDTLSTGVYKLVAYTNYMRNFPASSLTYSSVLIIGLKDDFKENTSNSKLSPNEYYKINHNINSILDNYSNNSNAMDIKLSANLNKQEFKQKEKVILTLSIADKEKNSLTGNASISVSEIAPVDYSNLNTDIQTFSSLTGLLTNVTNDTVSVRYNHIVRATNIYNNWLENIKTKGTYNISYKPEFIGYTISGKVTDKLNNHILKDTKILLSYPDSFAVMRYAIPDGNGNFLFALDRTFDNNKLFLNAFSNKASVDYNIELENKIYFDSNADQNKFVLNENLIKYFYQCKKIAVINKVFLGSNHENHKPFPSDNCINFYGEPNYIVELADYTELDDFMDISKNLLTAVKFKKKKDKYSISLTDVYLQQSWGTNCLVLLNNVPFFDLNYIATLGSKQIDRIEVLEKHIAYGEAEFFGIVAIFTKDKALIQNGRSVSIDNKVELPEINTKYESKEVDSKIPDFRQNLMWNPNIVLEKNKATTIEFYTSELKTSYIVDIEGVSSNGIPFCKKILLEVK